ncbi:MAG: preprotein translocase subunit SecA, partial [Coprobacillus sp.]|nr:preprotein translocase subunit SecA [Coprobacillus sp.]
GTAKTEEEEFRKIYNMRVICVPTNKRCIRKDDVDLVFAKKGPKLAALVKDVLHRHELGQPILIGTVSVESSEEIAKLLDEAGLKGKYEMLNAKNHAREAEIIARAGQKGAITLATNMAGRGTDIKLGEGVINNDLPEEYQGLCVLGTERHESRRIDNQLRGRSGRQGDIGYSRFYVSFDDTLLVRFAMDTARNYIERSFGDEPLETKMVSNIITSAQKRIEGQNFDTRKSLLDYDDVLAKQRQIVYDRRDKIIMGDNIDDIVDDVFQLTGRYLAQKAIPVGANNTLINGELLVKTVEPSYLPEGTLDPTLYNEVPAEDVAQELNLLIYERYVRYKKTWPEEMKDRVTRELILRTLDQNWTKHIDTMSRLRETIYLRSYAGVNPLQDYVNEGNQMFTDCLSLSAVNAVYALLNVKFKVQEQPQENPEANNTQPNGEGK